MTGMTLKQYARNEFFGALEAYRAALTSGTPAELLAASVRIQSAKGGVPKRLHSLVSKVWNEVTTAKAAKVAASA